MYPFLIVDDEPVLLKGLRYLLEQSELPVAFIQEASNGREALELASRDEIQIIITDIRMPDMDGLAFCHEMNSINRDSPIIILSGHDSFAYAREAIQYGVKDYLLKPVEKGAFLQSVQRVIQFLDEQAKTVFISDCDLAAAADRLFDGLHLNDSERVNGEFQFLQNMLAAYPLHTGIRAYKQVTQRLLSRLVKDLGPSFEPSNTDFKGNVKGGNLNMNLYDKIGMGYDTTRKADPYIIKRLAHYLDFEKAGKYIDIACGSGNYTIELAKKGFQLYGIDISGLMIAEARRKNLSVMWKIGAAENLPYPSGYFSGAACILAIHHFESMAASFKEAYRVMRSGQFVIFTSTCKQMEHYWLNEYFPNAMKASIDKMPSLSRIKQNLRDAGFVSILTEPYYVDNELQDLFLYSGKYKPELYLSSRIRAGISTFASLADGNEIENGCMRISDDIKSGRISDIIDSYKTEQGDYLFVVSSK